MKRALLAVLVVAALLAGGAWWFLNSLDYVVKTAIERFGPGLVGAPVTVREVSIAAREGRGVLRGLEVGNPPGYGAPRAIRAGTIAVSLDPSTLGADVVTIHDILVDAPEITYELKGGTNNLEAIRRHIEAGLGRAADGQARGEGAGKGGAPPSGRRYVIGRVTLRGARVTMTNPALKGQGITFALPDVDVRDLGRHGGGVTAGQAAERVAAALTGSVARTLLTNAELLRRGGVEGALDALRGVLR